MSTVVLFSERSGWHSAQLVKALQGLDLKVLPVSLRDCAISTVEDSGLRIPNLPDTSPDAALVRAIPGGSFEQVTFYLSMLHTLVEMGVPVVNSPRAIERTVDKGMTSVLLHRAAIPTPPTWVCVSDAQARAVVDTQLARGFELVRKPLFGSQGQGLIRLRRPEDLDCGKHGTTYGELYYLQRFVHPGDTGWHDWRVFVVNGVAVAAMRRQGNGTWINNLAQGAQCQAAVLQTELRKLSEATSRALELDYCGVDILRDARGGWWVVEVNSIPAWRGLQSVAPANIAERIAHSLVRHLSTRQASETVVL